MKETAVTTESVLSAARALVATEGRQHFTTMEIARHMGVEEYPVRAAVSWLNRYRMIEVVPGVRSQRYTRQSGEAYSATVYQIREQETAPDFTTLHMVFCCGGRR